MSFPNDDNDDDSFSSDSDDEFLTMRGDGQDVDREALVRKKLLESFVSKLETCFGHLISPMIMSKYQT